MYYTSLYRTRNTIKYHQIPSNATSNATSNALVLKVNSRSYERGFRKCVAPCCGHQRRLRPGTWRLGIFGIPEDGGARYIQVPHVFREALRLPWNCSQIEAWWNSPLNRFQWPLKCAGMRTWELKGTMTTLQMTSRQLPESSRVCHFGKQIVDATKCCCCKFANLSL